MHIERALIGVILKTDKQEDMNLGVKGDPGELKDRERGSQLSTGKWTVKPECVDKGGLVSITIFSEDCCIAWVFYNLFVLSSTIRHWNSDF